MVGHVQGKGCGGNLSVCGRLCTWGRSEHPCNYMGPLHPWAGCPQLPFSFLHVHLACQPSGTSWLDAEE